MLPAHNRFVLLSSIFHSLFLYSVCCRPAVVPVCTHIYADRICNSAVLTLCVLELCTSFVTMEACKAVCLIPRYYGTCSFWRAQPLDLLLHFIFVLSCLVVLIQSARSCTFVVIELI